MARKTTKFKAPVTQGQTETALTGIQSISTFSVPELSNPLRPNYETYRKIRRHPTVALGRALSAASALVSSWSVVSQTEDLEETQQDKRKQLIEEDVQPLHDHVVQQCMYYANTDFGWQGFEKIFKFYKGQIRLHRLKPLLQDITTILINPQTGAFAGFLQTNPFTGIDIVVPLEKSLLVSFRVEGTNWYGEPLLENVRDIYWKWQAAERTASDYDAKIAGTKPVVHYPPGSADFNGVETSNQEIAKQLLSLLARPNIGISIPSIGAAKYKDQLSKEAIELLQWKIELLSDDSPKQANFVIRLDYLDKLLLRGLITPERAMLEGHFGTKAEAGEHGSLALLQRQVEHDHITRMINWHVVDQLLAINFGEESRGSVCLEAAPLTSDQQTWLREIYKFLLSSPTGLDVTGTVDVVAIQDQLEVPWKEPEDDPGMDPKEIEKVRGLLDKDGDGDGDGDGNGDEDVDGNKSD